MQNKELKVGIYTLGCRVNQYESRAISEYLEDRGAVIAPFDSVCDVYVINTCAVTAESERKSRQMARRAHKLNPDAAIVITGCASQLHPETAAKLPGVVYVGGNASKLDAARAALELCGGDRGEPIMGRLTITDEYESYSVRTPDHTRAYVKIEDGCENKCAYCVIPKVRGPIRSKAPDEVLEEIRSLAAIGYKEIVLTGIETCSYQYGLTNIIKEVEKIEGIERIRLSSVNPSFINKRFTDEILGLEKFCPHFHLSLQSFCDKTLNSMRRKYNSKMIKENCAYLRRNIPGVCFTADMICGFPGESDEDFETTLQNVKELKLSFAHIFPYSDRPGTEASSMKDKVYEATKNSRCARLREAVCESREEIVSSFINKQNVFRVLIETEKDGYLFGHTENFIEVRVKAPSFARSLLGKVISVKLTKTEKIGGEIVVFADEV